jgi:hypothetical protein
MATPILAKFVSTIHGDTCQGKLTPSPVKLELPDQDVHTQMSVTVESGDVNKLIALPPTQGAAPSEQTFFFLTTTKNVQVRINGVTDMTFNIAEGGFWGYSGLPEIQQLEFSSLSGENAQVFITKLIGPQVLPVPPGGGGGVPIGSLRLEDIGPATLGQTLFTLPSVPTNPGDAVLFVEGVQYSSPAFFTISSNDLTWLDVPFTMPAGARVEIQYE